MIELLKKTLNLLYLNNKSVIINIDCIRTINLNQLKKMIERIE